MEIEIVGELISKPYIDITQSVMASFGVSLINDDYARLRVPAGQRYRGREYAIEADASNASYFLAAAAVTGGTVTLENLGSDSIQGDVHFLDVLERMGCAVMRGQSITLTGPAKLSAIDANMEAIPDMAQTLAVVAAFADGPSHITHISSLRVKETDRVQAIAKELPKLGVRVDEGPDYWTITPPADGAYTAAAIDTYDDHRMAMAFAVAGLRVPGVTINNPHVFIVEEGRQGSPYPAVLATKTRFDPQGLLNPGKLRDWAPAARPAPGSSPTGSPALPDLLAS